MDIKSLKYFLTAAREGSITKAANSLNLTQPNLSRQINNLEKEIGKKLFIRSNYSIKLTSDGILLKKRAEEIIDMIDKTRKEFQSSEDIIAGDIYIGSAETYYIKLIANIIKNLRKSHPNIIYHIHSGAYSEITEKLDKGLLDFGILIGNIDSSKYDYIDIPYKEVYGLLMRKDSHLSKNKFIEKNDLFDIPIICPKIFFNNKIQTSKFNEWIGNDFDKLNIILTYNLIYNAALMVEEGIGYALTIDKLVNTTNTSDLCFVYLKPKLEIELRVVWKKNQVFSEASKVFLNKLKEKL
ncbi:LysR family transcriptional regulator [Brachyspira hyodysenteriae]|uniref:Transcriptional regulator, LysR family n=1 Tax=Brachyspira hyodysenteriae (strain ATCC 49526 / WA1) TaxID=565034 RepID=A0A3B6VBA1_BRAHW|nr:LysR family transcriptional regulator [Brachyspira hyodysenteriae]ACN83143.1 transcriptional regulator, LysR family [Brachyspira hyodysenteriae WA1]KLI13685.1 LysR family transcriptional regulator [Brachyspira hyodysenteriae]KLI14849.1 LysR family transcriptional regulator [Brachyspira hyodysenteriae]KLI23267.1 LysR family transcriptional regulator [Brachyspira hyodysenteriae]KLI34129.1 LysR family transcriptional regulator [Brachyspira hyodysenteriae]